MLDLSTPLAILGGTGDLGSGLARRWAKAGFPIILGSRDPSRAQATADAINEWVGAERVRAANYENAATRAQVAVLTVPFQSQAAVLEQVKAALVGKILVDCTVPLRPPKVATVQLPPEGSAAQIGQAYLGKDVIVVSAFHNVSATLLQDEGDSIDCDVLICSDDAQARQTGVQLAMAAGLRGIEAGPLANSAASEALTSVLISINRRFKSTHAGIRITGLPQDTNT